MWVSVELCGWLCLGHLYGIRWYENRDRPATHYGLLE